MHYAHDKTKHFLLSLKQYYSVYFALNHHHRAFRPSPMRLHHSQSRRSTNSNLNVDSSSDQPTQIFHPSFVPKPTGLLGSAASGGHYSGAKVHHRRADIERASNSREPAEISEGHQRVLDDLKEVRVCCEGFFLLRLRSARMKCADSVSLLLVVLRSTDRGDLP